MKTKLPSSLLLSSILVFAAINYELLYIVSQGALPQSYRPTDHALWGAQSDESYVNPIVPADYSDIDAIRFDKRFYAISSTIQYSPGMAVLESSDLVHWKIVSHVVADISALDPNLNWDAMKGAGRGIWAGSIRYHAGRFHVYFGTPDKGIFVSSAISVLGPWSTPKLVLASSGWDDPCPFWDDDGKAYLVSTHFAPEGPEHTSYNIHLFRLDDSGERILPETDRVMYQSQGSEANKLYKIDGLYYHLFSEVHPEGRVIMMQRASSLSGPWELRQLNHVNAAVDNEPNQGGLIEVPSHRWWFVSHQGHGEWQGRSMVLLPVTWIDGWPIVGAPGKDGVGSMVWRDDSPLPFTRNDELVRNYTFSPAGLQPDWEWQYQPRATMWSLKERAGYLRLRAFASLHPGLRCAGNILTQRSFRSRSNEVTMVMDVSGMVDGQVAGLIHFGSTSASIAVEQVRGVRRLMFRNDTNQRLGPALTSRNIYLRSTWDDAGYSHFLYSSDGRRYSEFGDTYQLTWGDYRGDRIGMYTLNNDKDAGYVDIRSFRYTVSK